MVKILVFGSTGMLGSMVSGYLAAAGGLDVYGTARFRPFGSAIRFDASQAITEQLNTISSEYHWDFWINCIGIIKPYCKDNDPVGVRNAVRVNAVFPHELAAVASANRIRLIQIATDCVFSGSRGAYLETDLHDPLDVYGKTKSLGEVFDGSALNIRASIIGPELKGRLSLLEWFLHQPPGAELKGFTHHRWNGVTTLRFAQLCHEIIRRNRYDALVQLSLVHHYIPADKVSKYELLKLFQKTFDTNYTIIPIGDNGPPIDRTLAAKFDALASILTPITIAEDVGLLKEHMHRTA